MQSQTLVRNHATTCAVCTRLGAFEVPSQLATLVSELDTNIAAGLRDGEAYRADINRRILADVLQRHARSLETALSA